jgi:NitT/TauT family transport system substrate-binding protein
LKTVKTITRRDFIKTTGKSLALGATAGLTSGVWPVRKAFAAVPTINFAYVLSDHHAPMMVAARNQELFQKKFNMFLKPLSEGKFYEFYYDGVRTANVKLIPTKKGPDVEKLVAQGSVDIAISGTQAILMSIDKGVDTRIVSPLQTAGNVFVLNKKLPMNTWGEFIKAVKGSRRQFTIGMPGPHTVAAIIFRSALDYEGVCYTEDAADKKADILFINMKGHGNLVAALANDITQGIIGAQPFPSVTIDRGVGKFVLNLQDVPPGNRWQGHACCSLEATRKFLRQEPQLAAQLMELLALSVMLTNQDKDLAAQACSEWLGVSRSVETVAMESLNYTTEPSAQWKKSVYTYAETMDQMGMFTGNLKGVRDAGIDPIAFDFKLMEQAKANLRSKGIQI